MHEEISEALQRLEAILDKLPEPIAKSLKIQIQELRVMLIDKRPPRFALVGRRGSGKSSLINAIFGAYVADVGHEKAQTGTAKWWSYRGELGVIDVLDTRGLQEGSKPDEADNESNPMDSIMKALQEQSPDALMFLIKAKEADAAIETDLQALREISKEVGKAHHYVPPIVVVVTQCDELEPKNVKIHKPMDEDPEELEEKLQRIRSIETNLWQKVREYEDLKGQLVAVIGISSYQSWKRDKTRRYDERWRIDELLNFLSDELPNEAKLELARLSQVLRIQESIANKVTHTIAMTCAGIAAVPIPVADLAPITGLQTTLVMVIAFISGRQFSLKSSMEFLASLGVNVGAAFAFRELSRAVLKFVFPGGGSVISAAVAYGATVGIGNAAIAYFIRGVHKSQLKEIYEREKKKGQKEKESKKSI